MAGFVDEAAVFAQRVVVARINEPHPRIIRCDEELKTIFMKRLNKIERDRASSQVIMKVAALTY